jgi:RNA polymerase sigma-70 factor (ECF subfamily)
MSAPSRSQREASFELLYETCYRDIAAYVTRRTSPNDVGDVVAKVFAVAWRRFEHVPEPPDDRLWLFGVARRCLSDHRRSNSRQLRLRARLAREPVAGPSNGLSNNDDPRLALVVSAMAGLGPNDREALQLVLWEGLTHAQAATVLQCTVNAFEIRYRRARNIVKESVEETTSDRRAPRETSDELKRAKGVPQ